MKITVIGTGYVGLVSGIMFSHLGHEVTCLDSDKSKIAKLKQGVLPIYEPQLDEYLDKEVKSGRLDFADQYSEKLSNASVIFISVGTPSLPSGAANLQYIFEAVDNVSKWASQDCLIVIKSTVPPGTCQQVKDYLATKNLAFDIASNPEFLREGSAIEDFLKPDRIIIGTSNERSLQILSEVYAPLTKENVPLLNSDLATAELIKYGSNAFLAIKVAFINEMANLCEAIGGNIEKLSFGVGLDKRIGQHFLKAGPGFGGSCFPKDIMALSQIAALNNVDCKVLNATIEANKDRPLHMVQKISKILCNAQDSLKGAKLAILGLAFKAGTDDIRSSPAVEIIKLLEQSGAEVTAYDPVAMSNTIECLPHLQFANSAIEACHGADAVVITTEWSEFKELDLSLLYNTLKSPIIIDLRNAMNPIKIKQHGFKYYCLGSSNC